MPGTLSKLCPTIMTGSSGNVGGSGPLLTSSSRRPPADIDVPAPRTAALRHIDIGEQGHLMLIDVGRFSALHGIALTALCKTMTKSVVRTTLMVHDVPRLDGRKSPSNVMFS